MKRQDMIFALLTGLVLWGSPLHAQEHGTMCSLRAAGPQDCIRPAFFAFDTCQQIENTARRYGLDAGFFARLLWQESRFDPNALSPAGAQGIAQFMPGTAKQRNLPDSYNPAQAIERSAQYLGVLQRTYGNAGLAAVAYNGGERRADGFTQDGKGLARETVNYVQIITGLTAETWRDTPPKTHDFRLNGAQLFLAACVNMAKNRTYTKYKRPEPALKEWGAQLAFGATKSEAKQNLRRLTSRCKSLVAQEKIDYLTIKSRAARTGSYVMARVGRSSQKAAAQLCKSIRTKGCICRVYSNKG